MDSGGSCVRVCMRSAAGAGVLVGGCFLREPGLGGGFGVLRRSGVFGGGFTTRLRAVVWYAIGGSIFFSFSPLRKMCLVQTPHRSDFFLLFFFLGVKVTVRGL